MLSSQAEYSTGPLFPFFNTALLKSCLFFPNSYITSSSNTISLSFCCVGWDLWVSEFFKMTVSADKVYLAHFQLISSSIKTSFSVMFLPICFCHSSTWMPTIKSDIRLCRHYHKDAQSRYLNSGMFRAEP